MSYCLPIRYELFASDLLLAYHFFSGVLAKFCRYYVKLLVYEPIRY